MANIPPPKTSEFKPETVQKIGRALGGTHWQADVARDIDYSKSMVSRVVSGTRVPDEHFANGFREAMLDKISTVNSLLTSSGLPYFDDPETRRAQKMIAEAIKILRH